MPIYVFAVHANMHLTLKLWMDLIQIFDEELAGCFSDILKVGWWVLLCFGENLLSPRRRQEILHIHDFTSKWGKGDALRKIVKQSQGGAGR